MPTQQKPLTTRSPALPSAAPDAIVAGLLAQPVEHAKAQLHAFFSEIVNTALDQQTRAPALLTRDQLAQQLQICTRTLTTRLIDQGLPRYIVGGVERFDLQEVLTWLRSRRGDAA